MPLLFDYWLLLLIILQKILYHHNTKTQKVIWLCANYLNPTRPCVLSFGCTGKCDQLMFCSLASVHGIGRRFIFTFTVLIFMEILQLSWSLYSGFLICRQGNRKQFDKAATRLPLSLKSCCWLFTFSQLHFYNFLFFSTFFLLQTFCEQQPKKYLGWTDILYMMTT